MRSPRIILLLITAAVGGVWAGWEAYRKVADEMSQAAARQNRRRVAVIGFSSENGRKDRSASIIAERLTSEMAGRPEVEIIERSKLDQILREQKLQSKGLVDPVTAKKIGNILGVDAVVTGTVISLDDGNVELNARLVDTQDARVLKAVTKKIKKDWEEPRSGLESFDFNMDLDLDGAPQPLLPDGFLDWGSSDSCERFTPEGERALRRALELKARKLAHAVADGQVDLGALKKNPGSEIRDEALRRDFYASFKDWHARGGGQPLTYAEEQELEEALPAIASYPCAR